MSAASRVYCIVTDIVSHLYGHSFWEYGTLLQYHKLFELYYWHEHWRVHVPSTVNISQYFYIGNPISTYACIHAETFINSSGHCKQT